MRILSWIIFITVALAAGGCSSKESKGSGNDYETAKDLLDQGRSTEAINLMDKVLAQNSYDMQARLLLAMGYATRAGIFVRDFTDFARQVVATSNEIDDLMSRNGGLFKQFKGKGEEQSKIVVAFEHLMRATLRIDGLLRSFEFLPVVQNEEEWRDLQAAITVLDQEKRYRGGPALYRALLRISFFKYDLKDRYDFTHLRRCEIDTGLLATQIEGLHTDLFRILTDIAYGISDPDRQKRMYEFSRKLNIDMRLAVASLKQFHQRNVDVSQLVSRIHGNCRNEPAPPKQKAQPVLTPKEQAEDE